MVAWAAEFAELRDIPQTILAILATMMVALATWAQMATRSMRAAIVREHLTRAGGATIVLGAIFTLTVVVAVTEERLEPEAHAPDEIVGQLDRSVRGTAHRLAQWPAVRRVAAELSQLAGGGLAAVVLGTVGYLIGCGSRREAGVVLGGTLWAALLAAGLKALFALPSPRLLESLSGAPLGHGFPSSHALMTAAICGLCAWAVGRRLDRRRQIVLSGLVVMVAGAMGAARIVVDAHWFSDVVAGLAMGSLWVCLVLMVVIGRPGRPMAPGGAPARRPDTPGVAERAGVQLTTLLLDPAAVRTVLGAEPVQVQQLIRTGGWGFGLRTKVTELSSEAFAGWLTAPPAQCPDPALHESDRIAALALAYYQRRHQDADPRRLAVAATLLAEWSSGAWVGWPVAEDLRDWAAVIVLRMVKEAAVLDTQPTAEVVGCRDVGGRDAPLMSAQARFAVALLEELLFRPRAPALPEEVCPMRLLRTGDASVSFRGRRIAAVDGPVHGRRVLGRWYDLALYAADDQTALLEIVYRTRHAEELDHHTVIRLAALDRDLVTAECLDYDPLGPALGSLAPEAQPGARYGLRNRLQRIYGARVSALLGLAFGEAS